MTIPLLTMALTLARVEQDPSWTIDRVRAAAAAHRQRLQSVLIEFRTKGRGADSPPGVYDHRRLLFAAKGEKRFVESGHIYPGFDWDEDPNASQSYYTGETYDALLIARRFYQTSKKDARGAGTLRVRGDLFTECTGWWPPDDKSTPPPPFRPETLLHVALNRNGVNVRRALEQIGLYRCVVVELPGQDTLWLDVDRGCAVVRRVIPNVRDGLHMLCENSDLAEVAPGIWLPKTLRRVVHRGTPGGIGTQPDAVWMEATYTAHRIEANGVPDHIFVFTPPPGTIMADKDQGSMWPIAGGLDFLDYSCRVGGKHLEPAAEPPTTWQSRLIASDLAAVALALPAVVLIFRRRTWFSRRAHGVPDRQLSVARSS